MWVHPDWRGRGVGDLLVTAVIDWARAAGYPAVRLWVSADNTPAERLYLRHGFRRTGERQLIDAEAPARGDEVAMLRPLAAEADPPGHSACSQRAGTP
jgi:ribosomal protein S18 acetylase RimI-like enzyme